MKQLVFENETHSAITKKRNNKQMVIEWWEDAGGKTAMLLCCYTANIIINVRWIVLLLLLLLHWFLLLWKFARLQQPQSNQTITIGGGGGVESSAHCALHLGNELRGVRGEVWGVRGGGIASWPAPNRLYLWVADMGISEVWVRKWHERTGHCRVLACVQRVVLLHVPLART